MFEPIVILVVAVGAAVGISVALATQYKKSSRKTANFKIQAANPISDLARKHGDENPPIPQEAIETNTTFDTSEGFQRSEPVPTAPLVPSVNVFQSQSDETEATRSLHFFTDVAQAEATISNESNPAFDSESKTYEHQDSPLNENPIPASSKVDEPISTEPNTHDSSSFTSTLALAVPTDNAALENIGPALLPVGARSAAPNTLNSARVSNYGNITTAYCVKCKSKKQIRDPQAVTMKNGRAAISGFCYDCGTRVFRIGRASTA